MGGNGDDVLIGGAGDDFMVGSAGQDTFVFDSNFGSDLIADFSGKDQIWLTAKINGSGINNARDVAQFVTGNATTPRSPSARTASASKASARTISVST